MVDGVDLYDAIRAIEIVRRERMNAGDRPTAGRLEVLSILVENEADMVEGVARHGLPVPVPTCPPGRTGGWMIRNDPVTRAKRELIGLLESVGADRG